VLTLANTTVSKRRFKRVFRDRHAAPRRFSSPRLQLQISLFGRADRKGQPERERGAAAVFVYIVKRAIYINYGVINQHSKHSLMAL